MNRNIILRQTTHTDFNPVYHLIKTAFETAEHRDGNEQDFATGLRHSDNYIPQLDLVAELNNQLIGHILFTKLYIAQPDGSRYKTLLVAPLSVLIEVRNTGVGSALMNEGFRIAETLGYGSAFLLGDPNYYKRFGYKPAHLFGITHESFPKEYLLGKEIIPETLNGITGTVII